MSYIGKFHWKTFTNDFFVPYIVSNTLYNRLSGDFSEVIRESDIDLEEARDTVRNFFRNTIGFIPSFSLPVKQSVSNAPKLAYFDIICGFPFQSISTSGTSEELESISGFMLPPIEVTGSSFNTNQTASDTALNYGGSSSQYTHFPNFAVAFTYRSANRFAVSYNIPVIPESVIENGVFVSSFQRHEFSITLSVDTSATKPIESLYAILTNYPIGGDSTKFTELLINTPVERYSFDPYTPNQVGSGSPSSQGQGGDGTGGGWGDFDYSSNGPQDKNPPTVSTYDAGFCTLYAATQAQIKALADYMWADTGDFVNNWNKLWANPMDAILGISLVPLSGLLTGVSTAVKVGNIATSVYMTKLSASIVRVDCGTLYITSQSLSHSFMDFPPYNQVELYLPYIGTVSISASDVIDKYLSISYLCDCLSGSCVAFVMSSGYTVATYSGNIAAAVPVTSGDFANIVFAALDYLKVGGQDVAAGIGGIMASKGGGLKGARGIAETVSAGASLVEHTFEIGQSILVPQITKGGPAGSTAGYMNHQKPFLIFNAPNVAAPENMNTYIGYAQYETKSLGACSGFTKVAEIHYRGSGTEIERAEIENLLRAGVDL